MTVAAKEALGSPEGGAGGKGKKRKLSRAGNGGWGAARGANPWQRLWQVPLLLAGVAGFGWGLRALVKSIHPVPFAQQARGIQALLNSGEYAKAVDQINILGNYYKKPLEQGQLQEFAGDAHFLAEEKQLAGGAVLVPTTFDWTQKHNAYAVRLGIVPAPKMNERWGLAAMGLGDAKGGAEKLEEAIAAAGAAQQTELLEKHGRQLIAAYLELGDSAKALSMVDRMLAEELKNPIGSPQSGGASKAGESTDAASARAMEEIQDRVWGLCTRIQIALSAKNTEALAAAINGARAALVGLREDDAMGRVLAWIGRAEWEQGDSAAAEKDLARARGLFSVRHLDDGRAGVLLARIDEAKGDWAAAEKLFQEVVTDQAATTIWAAGRLGRGEAAAMKNQPGDQQTFDDYRFAIDAANQVDGTGPKPPVGQAPELIDSAQVRSSLQGAFESAAKGDRLDDALKFLAAGTKNRGGADGKDVTGPGDDAGKARRRNARPGDENGRG